MKKQKEENKKQSKISQKVKHFNVGNYPVGDFLIRIKNAAMARANSVEFPSTKFVVSVAKALVKEGYLEEIREEEGVLSVRLKFRKKEPLIGNITLISKPGLRIYMKTEDLEAKKGPSIFILTTPVGVMSSKEAVKKRLGGEVVAEVL